MIDEVTTWSIALVVGMTLAAITFGIIFYPTLNMQPDPLTIKIMRGDLPDCETTIGSDTGYYCQINRTSYYCMIEKHAVDSFVRNHPYCEQVILV